MYVLLWEKNIKFILEIKFKGWVERKGESLVRWFYNVVLGNKIKGDISRRKIVKKGDIRIIEYFSFLGFVVRKWGI